MDKKSISDPAQNLTNIEKHGVPLSLAGEMLANRTAEFEDNRCDYQEIRNVTFAYVGERLYVAVWMEREGIIRSISVRKANKREVQRYG